MIKSFRVEAADNGYVLNYCVEKKATTPVGTYNNSTYEDKEEVFMKKDQAALLSRVSELLAVIGKGKTEEVKPEKAEALPEIEY